MSCPRANGIYCKTSLDIIRHLARLYLKSRQRSLDLENARADAWLAICALGQTLQKINPALRGEASEMGMSPAGTFRKWHLASSMSVYVPGTKSLRSSPLRGGKSREVGSQSRGQR